MKVDARGKECPQPVVMTKKALDSIEEGIVTVLLDSEISRDNVLKFAQSQGLSADVSEKNGEFTIEIAKGFTCATPADEQAGKPDDTKVVLYVGSESIGSGDCDLGKKLMNNFIKNIENMNYLPKTIICVNSGVFLTTTNDETIKALWQLKGVNVLSCGTCLEYFNLEDDLQVGEITDAYTVMKKLFDADKVIRL
ncbi:MAG: sulfurtransferase-like selenium metabolism protein YedF [Flexistipes sinusarabici]|uniref:Sulfurtransferase-like selenium metabolism protein YedF n=1 Tax=Flexistipes sinusarabici TaxID=2352 RepID=A0A5D0MID1_FLESI|nr:sulfurtransferase-like selenium metabolism protein YedF [Flexistipes sinusarabici]TYB33437.1 MAG: sulfurtransferase-like selenium metabolism protein YedF [Flexistipes sinusarabici]